MTDLIEITEAQFEQALKDGKMPDKDKSFTKGNILYIYFEEKWYKVE